jgi:23S rRNA (pseudouridine1915-N3)-methyltransferase
MKWLVLAIGKPQLAYARAGVDEYLARLQRMADVRVEFLKSPGAERESALLLEKSEGWRRIVLDERGAEVGSREFAAKVSAWEMAGTKGMALLIGGANGHTEELRRAADWTWALGKLTLQHELALVVLLEQLYRAYSIKQGQPYHRD